MMFPHNGKIVTIDQVSHYEPNPSANIDNILPLIHTSHDAYPLVEMGPGIFKDPSLLGTVPWSTTTPSSFQSSMHHII
jgi:hypothetical protein